VLVPVICQRLGWLAPVKVPPLPVNTWMFVKGNDPAAELACCFWRSTAQVLAPLCEKSRALPRPSPPSMVPPIVALGVMNSKMSLSLPPVRFWKLTNAMLEAAPNGVAGLATVPVLTSVMVQITGLFVNGFGPISVSARLVWPMIF